VAISIDAVDRPPGRAIACCSTGGPPIRARHRARLHRLVLAAVSLPVPAGYLFDLTSDYSTSVLIAHRPAGSAGMEKSAWAP
jgi:hypothetical protein